MHSSPGAAIHNWLGVPKFYVRSEVRVAVVGALPGWTCFTESLPGGVGLLALFLLGLRIDVSTLTSDPNFMNERVKSVKNLLLEALEIENPQDRDRFLAAACGGDLVLRAEVEELIGAQAAAGGFLPETPTRPVTGRNIPCRRPLNKSRQSEWLD